MRLTVRTESRHVRRAGSFTISAFVHGTVLAWVALGPLIPKGERPNLYEQAIQPNERRIVWYNLKQQLPEITPAERKHDPQPPRALRRAPQTLVAGKEELLRPPQLIWAPAPEIELQKMLPSPNVVSVARPVRRFEPSPEPPRPERPAPALPDAPLIAADRTTAAPNLPAARPQPRTFTPSKETPKTETAPVLPTAPELTVAMEKSPASINGLPPLQAARRTFIPPVEAKPSPVSNNVNSLPDAPQVQQAMASETPQIPGAALAKAVRPFVPPARGGSGSAPAPAGGPAVPMPEAPAADRPAEASLAIVGLFPSRSTEIPAPKVSQQGGFSAGPQRREDGDVATAQAGVLEVPGLLTRGSQPDARPVLMASLEAPTSRRNLLAAAASARVGDPATPAGPVDPHGAARVSDPPDPRMRGRAVYSMAIQMPNVTSFSGSWLVWFAARDAAAAHIGGVQAPTPIRKVDPKYIASALQDRIEGKVRLWAVIRKDGHVDTLELLQHLDSRLDQSAQEALAKWEFEPAMRNGIPIDVDAIFDIPFHVAPRPK
jgi:TonB family protein